MDGGDFRCLAKIGTDIYAGSQYGGVFRSTNNGDSWAPLLNGLPAGVSVTSFMNNGAKLFAGTSYWSLEGEGIYRSDDNGMTWMQKNEGIQVNSTPSFSDLSITSLAKTSSYVYASTQQNGIYKSANDGDNWQKVFEEYNSDSSAFRQIYAICSIGDILIAGGTTGLQEGGIFRSLDQGLTWELITTGFPSGSIVYQLLSSGVDLYARTSHGLFWSPSNGDYWIAISSGISTPTGAGSGAISAEGTVLFAATYDGNEGPKTYKSTNRGTTWTNIPAMNSYYVMTLLNIGSNVFAGNIGNYGMSSNGGGVVRSTDGGTNWSQASIGLSGLNCMAIISNGTDVFAGTRYNSGIYKSGNNGANWSKSLLPGTTSNNSILSMLSTASVIYAGVNTSGVYKSIDNGQNWTATAAIPKPIYALGANATYLFAGTSNDGMRRSSDGGTTWATINTGLTTISQKSIRAIAVNGSKIYIGTSNGVFRSINDGTNWTAANSSPGNTSVKSLVVKGDTIVAGRLRSFNNGVTWTVLSAAPSIINALLLDGSTIYSGGTAGVHVSTDWGETWNNLNTTFPLIPEVYSLYILDNKLYAGTYGQAVWTYDLAPATKTLTLSSVFPEGLYAGSGTLNQANDDMGAHWPVGVADQITVELHDAANYSIIIYTASAVNLSTTGTASVTIPSTFTGSYYITVKHRNSLQTVSATAKSFAGSTITQSFGTPADVFGGNLVQMPDLGYAIYGGDVNQDGIVDGSDFAMVDNLATQASSGYLPEDANGDGLIDGSDFAIIDNIASQAIGAVTP